MAAKGPARKLSQKCRRSDVDGGGSDGKGTEEGLTGQTRVYVGERAERNYCRTVFGVEGKEGTRAWRLLDLASAQ